MVLLNYKSMQEQTGYNLTDEQQENALQQVIRYYHHRKDELGRVWKAEEEINLVLPDYILQGVIDLIEGQGDTIEIVDYKTGPKPDIKGHPERVEHYRKQLEIYAYLIENGMERKSDGCICIIQTVRMKIRLLLLSGQGVPLTQPLKKYLKL